MNENLKKLLRNVFSVDTKAGHKITYHIMRALACPNYAKAIRFNPEGVGGLLVIFEWAATSERKEYWSDIRNSSVNCVEYI